jgi:hypothetical protein
MLLCGKASLQSTGYAVKTNELQYLEIMFLPWITFTRDFAIGPVRLWDYSRRAGEEITNPTVASHLAKYFGSYVDHDGTPVKSLTICSHGQTDLRALKSDERREMRRAADVLVFGTIAPQAKVAVCAGNPTIGPPSANIFELVGQRFTPGDEWLAIRAGSAVHTWNISQVQFSIPKPWATGGTFGSPDEALLDALGNMLLSRPPVAARVFRSLEWYRMAKVEDDQISLLTRAVMMATAFEILLEFPQQGKRRHFVDYVEREIADPKCKRETRTHEGGRVFDLSLPGCWAWDFYDLRSRIVHGDEVRPQDLLFKDWITHLIVADLMFLLCMQALLFEMKFLGEAWRRDAAEMRKSVEARDPLADWERAFARMHFDIANIHRALGWR